MVDRECEIVGIMPAHNFNTFLLLIEPFFVTKWSNESAWMTFKILLTAASAKSSYYINIKGIVIVNKNLVEINCTHTFKSYI